MRRLLHLLEEAVDIPWHALAPRYQAGGGKQAEVRRHLWWVLNRHLHVQVGLHRRLAEWRAAQFRHVMRQCALRVQRTFGDQLGGDQAGDRLGH
ncbi:hypothetical protein D3C79_816300 [compost metagenome]